MEQPLQMHNWRQVLSEKGLQFSVHHNEERLGYRVFILFGMPQTVPVS